MPANAKRDFCEGWAEFRERAGLFGEYFGALQLLADYRNPGEHLGSQLLRYCLVTAALVDQLLDEFFQAVLSQARPALVQVLLDLGGIAGLHLLVNVGVDQREHLGAGHLVRLAAAHFASFPEASPSARAMVGADGAVASIPCSVRSDHCARRGRRLREG